ncbi:MAG TPA: fumarylacetoacetate hydrolase family protein [Casimicrobiaceae bacterium]|nr:fumarylacetoacetate hydrolase family protein [Casimicrobiaceae bacterium]
MAPRSSLPNYLAPLRDALIEARRSHTTVDPRALPVPQSDADAYAVQDAVADAFDWFGAPAKAWKVGAASRTATPSAAPLPAHSVVDSPATFARSTFNRILIEGEIAFRLRAPLRAEVPDHVLDAVSASIGDLVVTIEVVDPRYSDLDAAAPALRLADQGLNGALVVGSGVPWRGSLDWSAQVAILRQNGNVVRQTRGGHPLGDLLFLVEWLAGHAQQRGPSLPAGTIITAGTWTGVFEAAAGDTIEAEFPGVGRASARFG